MSSNETEILTVRELAKACNCSKIPVIKQLNKLQLPTTYKLQLGKKVTAYKLTRQQISAMVNAIQKNKSGSVTDYTLNDYITSVTDDNGQIVVPSYTQSKADKQKETVNSIGTYGELLDKYMEIKSMYDIANTSLKLLEDRQSSTLARVNEIQAEKETLLSETATLKAEVSHRDDEINKINKKVEGYKRSLIASCVVTLILLLMVLASLVMR